MIKFYKFVSFSPLNLINSRNAKIVLTNKGKIWGSVKAIPKTAGCCQKVDYPRIETKQSQDMVSGLHLSKHNQECKSTVNMLRIEEDFLNSLMKNFTHIFYDYTTEQKRS